MGSDDELYHQQEFKDQVFTHFLYYSASNLRMKESAIHTIEVIVANNYASLDQIQEYIENGTVGIASFYEEQLDQNFRSLSLGEMCAVLVQMYQLKLE